MKPLRIAVIGAGHLGRIHTRLAQTHEHVEVAAVADPDPAARRRVREELGVAGVASFADLLEADAIDAAIVAAPSALHYRIGGELLESGVHVFMEKPITLAVHDADALIAAADRRKLVLQVGHVERFNPAVAAAAPHVSEPHYIESVRAGGYTFRCIDAGVVLDLMIHDIDIALSLVGQEVVKVEAHGAAVLGPHEDFAWARLTFAGGCVAELKASRASMEGARSMQVFGRDALVGVDFASRTASVMRPCGAWCEHPPQASEISPQQKEHIRENFFTEFLPLEQLEVAECNPLLEEQRDFFHSIRHGTQPRVTGRAGREALAVADRILACMHTRHWSSSAGKRAAAILPGPQATAPDSREHRKAG